MTGFPPTNDSRVTLANWQLAPFNRWGFLHTREIIPTANISRAEGEAWWLRQGDDGLESLAIIEADGRSLTLADYLEDSWTDGLMVVQRGRIRLEAYRNGMTPTSRHVAMSVSKSITSLFIGVLVDRQMIDPAAEVTHYLPELAKTAYEGATIQHVLDMQVANAWREDYFSETTEYWRLDVAAGWLPPRDGAAATLFDFMKSSRRHGSHGQRIQYSSLNTDLLGLIAERVTGLRFADLVSTLLWQPAGMEFDADMTLDPGGMAAADGGYCITLRDLARIGQLFLNGGSGGGGEVVPVGWIEECRRPNRTPFDSSSYGVELGGASYHNHWWLLDDRSFALGIHGQMIAVDFKTSLVVVFVSSAPEPNDSRQRAMQRRIVGALARLLGV